MEMLSAPEIVVYCWFSTLPVRMAGPVQAGLSVCAEIRCGCLLLRWINSPWKKHLTVNQETSSNLKFSTN